ncbi:hypothetical protein CXB49_09530 [Chromobacterium sp. ATCC 53434]|uniref:RHS repeat-associated core domain-containing protein n=1 Tax=Chromobacterium TaxID=535 RepID=UPI000C787272|nr:RHS repeat-associated core domain-containing protein [Chromobacterium sp. ATCC 53434]AUH51035.1 hypothetical protein CXB49_09530 [Chromobacterium sp. ATCC 53434]
MDSGVLGFNGQRLDPVGSATHLGNGYRAYSPALMRFHSPDSLSPFGAGGVNPYAYCAGDPVNRADPSGHLSWQAWTAIGLGVAGLGLAAVTKGLSIAASGGIIAALESASAASLVIGGAAVVADVAAITSGAMEESNPKMSSILGWVSLGRGAVVGGAATSRGILHATSGVRARLGRLMHVGLSGKGGLTAGAKLANHTLETLPQDDPGAFRLLLAHLSGRDVDKLRQTSTTLRVEVEQHLGDIRTYLPTRSTGKITVAPLNSEASITVENVNRDYVLKVREIALGMHTYMPPTKLAKAGIKPLSEELMLTYTIDAYESSPAMEGAFGERGFRTSNLWAAADETDSAFKTALRYQAKNDGLATELVDGYQSTLLNFLEQLE